MNNFFYDHPKDLQLRTNCTTSSFRAFNIRLTNQPYCTSCNYYVIPIRLLNIFSHTIDFLSYAESPETVLFLTVMYFHLACNLCVFLYPVCYIILQSREFKGLLETLMRFLTYLRTMSAM